MTDDFEILPRESRQGLTDTLYGVAGVATLATASVLVAYAVQRFNLPPSLVVDSQQLNDLATLGQAHANAVVRGLSRIQHLMEDVVQSRPHAHGATVGDLFRTLSERGGEVTVLKDAIASYVQACGGSVSEATARQLLDPATPLGPTIQRHVAGAIWQHDKQVALTTQNLSFIADLARSCAVVATGSMIGLVVRERERAERVMASIQQIAARVAMRIGLMSPREAQQVACMIERSSPDPQASRGFRARDEVGRDDLGFRSLTRAWLDAEAHPAPAVALRLFEIEPVIAGRHTEVGRAVMVQRFDSAALRELASTRPHHADVLIEIAERRQKLEDSGHVPRPLPQAVDPTLQDGAAGIDPIPPTSARTRRRGLALS